MEIHEARDTVELYDKIHNMAMDKESPTRACNGRAAKHFLGAFESYMDAEKERCSEFGHVLCGILSGTLTILVTFLNFAPPSIRRTLAAEIAANLIDGLYKGVERSIELDAREAAAQKGAAQCGQSS